MAGSEYVEQLATALRRGDVERALVAVAGVLTLLAVGPRACVDREPAVAQGHDELLSVRQAAERLSTSTDWLYRHSADLPFTRRLGRQLRFSARGIDAYLQTHKAAL